MSGTTVFNDTVINEIFQAKSPLEIKSLISRATARLNNADKFKIARTVDSLFEKFGEPEYTEHLRTELQKYAANLRLAKLGMRV